MAPALSSRGQSVRISIKYAEPERKNFPLMRQADTANGDMVKQPAYIDQANGCHLAYKGR